MNDRDLIKQLQSLKDAPELGGGFDVESVWSKFASEHDFPTETKDIHYGFRDYAEYYVWRLTHNAIRPLATSFAIVVFMVAGWVGSTNASFDSLPGDRLYPVKLTMEKVQLAVALNAEQKSRLELEFTSRRLNEMVELTAERSLANPVRIQMAVNSFKDSVTSLSTELSHNDSTELAKAVGRKTQTYKTTVKASSTDVPTEVAKQVAEVQKIIDDTQDQAMDVIITAHENQEDAVISEELKQSFEKQLASLSATDNTELTTKLAQAQALANEGSYRRAFQLLKEIELILNASSN